MEIATFIEILTLIMGGGGIGAVVTWGYLRRQEAAKTKEQEANAVTAEVNAFKEMQDAYQQMITDLKEAWKEQKEYIDQLNRDRHNLRQERDDLRMAVDKLRREQISQAEKIARLGRVVGALKPLICSLSGCKKRESDIIGLIDDASFETNNDDENEEDEEVDKRDRANKKRK